MAVTSAMPAAVAVATVMATAKRSVDAHVKIIASVNIEMDEGDVWRGVCTAITVSLIKFGVRRSFRHVAPILIANLEVRLNAYAGTSV